jgi:hypothetical protein
MHLQLCSKQQLCTPVMVAAHYSRALQFVNSLQQCVLLCACCYSTAHCSQPLLLLNVQVLLLVLLLVILLLLLLLLLLTALIIMRCIQELAR